MSAPPASSPSRSPSPVLHGLARSTTCSASGVTCCRTSSRSPWKPPVASTTGTPRQAREAAPRAARRLPGENAGQPVRLEADAFRQLVPGFPRDDRSAERLEPPRAPRRARRGRVAGEPRRRPGTRRGTAPSPGSARRPAREPHRPAGPVALLVDDDRGAELTGAHGRDEAGEPGPCDDEASRLDEREARLVLDVLDLHAVRAPEEDRVGIRGVDDVGDLDPELVRAAMCSSAESTRTARWFRSGSLGRADLAAVELDVGAADLDARSLGQARRDRIEAEPDVLGGRFLRRTRSRARRDRGRSRGPSRPRRSRSGDPRRRRREAVRALLGLGGELVLDRVEARREGRCA